MWLNNRVLRQIAALYEVLARRTGSPVVELNRAIALAELGGPEAGLAITDASERALELTQTHPERRFLRGRLDELTPRD